MTEQSQMPLVGPPTRRGWRDIVWFRPLTSSTHAALVVTRRGRLVSILPAGGPRVLSDYLAWPYDFREVDTRERLLVLDQRVESFDSSYEFPISLRLIYQVVQPDRVALELDDVTTELTHAVVQSLRVSGRSFGVEQDKTFEEHLQETLISSDALVQRAQLLGLVLRRADVTITLDEAARTHAEALRFAMRERPLHFQLAVESLEPDRSFDVVVGGTYRLTARRSSDSQADTVDSAIQLAIAHTLRRVGITFAPSDYSDAARAMAEVLRKDALLQSELSLVQAQLLRPTVQIQPDRSMVHVPRPTMLAAPDTRPDPLVRRARQGLPRMGRSPALTDSQERAPEQAPAPVVRRALPPPPPPSPADLAARWALPPEPQPAQSDASQTLPLGELPAPGEPIEGAFTRWSLPESMPAMRARPMLGQPDDTQDARAPWADLISGAETPSNSIPWAAALPPAGEELAGPQPWDSLAADAAVESLLDDQTPTWLAAPPTPPEELAEPQLWDVGAADSAQPTIDEQMPAWSVTPPELLSEPVPAWLATPTIEDEPQPWQPFTAETAEHPLAEEPETPWATMLPATGNESHESQPWQPFTVQTAEQPRVEEPETSWATMLPATGDETLESPPWQPFAAETAEQPALDVAPAAEEPWSALDTIAGSEFVAEARVPNNQPADDLGFSLDWSEPELAGSMAEADDSSLAPMGDMPADDLGFTLDWSEPQADLYTSIWAPSATPPTEASASSARWEDTNTDLAADEGMITAHWDESSIAFPEPAHSSDLPAIADIPTDTMSVQGAPISEFDLDLALSDLEQPHSSDISTEAEQGADHDAAWVVEQQSPAWDAPTPQLDEHLPFDSVADDSGYVPFEAQAAAWPDPSAALTTPDYELTDDTAPLPETAELPESDWAEAQAAPSLAEYDLAADAFAQRPSEALDQDPTTAIEPASDLAPDSASDLVMAGAEAEPEVPSEQISRMIGMIQSYGPAWFKMWSLELKERPERLPVVLGEVTADPTLLAQANDPHVQSALLAALAAYAPPTAFPARQPALAALPRPAIAGQASSDEDEVPDWLSLRVKWNGQGGGA